jgi:hypothetical protein
LVPLLALQLFGCGEVDDRPAQWGYVSAALFQPSCATVSCHSRTAAVAGLDFSAPDRGYDSLTGLPIWIVDPEGTPDKGCKPAAGTVVCERPRRPMVVAYDPASSRVVNMLRARGASRMPPDRPLPEADIALIERWILNGARRTPDGPAAPTDPNAPVDAGATVEDASAGADAARADGMSADAGDDR